MEQIYSSASIVANQVLAADLFGKLQSKQFQ